MLLPIFVRERPSELVAAESANDDAPQESVMRNLVRAFSLRSTLIGAAIALGIRVGIGVLSAVFVDYLMKDAGWTQQEYTTFAGGYAVGLGLVGSVAGGFIADRFGCKSIILLSSFLLGALWIGFGIETSAIESKRAVQVMLLGQELLLAILSVALFSLFMGISWPKVAATQFTAYMALMNFSTTIGSYLAGALQEYSIFQILIVAGVAQILLSLPVLLINPQQTRQVLGDD